MIQSLSGIASVVATALCFMHASEVLASDAARTNEPAALEAQIAPTTSEDGPELHMLTFDYAATFASAYLFQGIDYSDGKAVVQPRFGVAWEHVSTAVWLNHDLNSSHTDEYDVTLQYTWSASPVSVSGGYMYLTYPHREGWESSQEVLLDVNLESLLAPALSLHYDFDAGRGAYSTAGISHEIALPVQALTVGSSIHYQRGYYDLSGFPACELNVSAEREIGPFAVTPSVSRFVTWANGDFRGELAVPSTWLYSISMAQEF